MPKLSSIWSRNQLQERMQEENKLTLLANNSTHSKRVELALKIKGIFLEFVRNKSPSPTQPSSQRGTVLIHNGRAIVESLVIIEYIDETWKHEPKLLPIEPYDRARVRFWAAYPRSCFPREKHRKACEKLWERQQVLEEGMKGRKIHREQWDALDIMMAATLYAYKAQEEVLAVKILHSYLPGDNITRADCRERSYSST
ncbi:glutathione S-transferase U10-like [Lycium ferocissimum]|uniref:glutathione S-transferase U10-like n=1 Tax=Lycium ferocissimum TaxID=112874 RepID=UPI0028166F20|nr:glutathione S-transferase U10-like [Lycium ferocissimum]